MRGGASLSLRAALGATCRCEKCPRGHDYDADRPTHDPLVPQGARLEHALRVDVDADAYLPRGLAPHERQQRGAQGTSFGRAE